MRFPYRAYEVSESPASGGIDGRVYRPIIPFTVRGPSETLDFYGLLDTGADESYLTQSIADRLGLDILEESDCTIESASGDMVVRYAVVTIELSDGTETYEWQATVGITVQDWSEAILGHNGFLEYFDVLFCGHRREVELTRNKATHPSDRNEA